MCDIWSTCQEMCSGCYDNGQVELASSPYNRLLSPITERQDPAKRTATFPILRLAVLGSDDTLDRVKGQLPLNRKLIVDLGGQGEHCLFVIDGRIAENLRMANVSLFLYIADSENSVTNCNLLIAATKNDRLCPAILSQIGQTTENQVILNARALSEAHNMIFYQYDPSCVVKKCLAELDSGSWGISSQPATAASRSSSGVDGRRCIVM